jgi:adenine-specific DNA methylase
MSIEKHFNVAFIANLALREKQIQQNYRPIIAVHKWFARRPGTLFRGLVLSEFGTRPLREAFFCANNFEGICIADPFMGGGTPLIEANRVGCDVIGYDINPMAYWIVHQEIEHVDLKVYKKAANALTNWLENEIGHLYRTRCLECGSPQAHVKYFLWVKERSCRYCGKDFDLFPGYLVAENKRHPQNVIVCKSCGELNEVRDRKQPQDCGFCRKPLLLAGPAKRNSCPCSHCGKVNIYPDPTSGPPRHRMFAIEYHCSHCRVNHKGRFFKKPSEEDLAKYAEAASRWEKLQHQFVPDDEIPAGDETDRLHRWGYRRYQEMFNVRQLLGLELSCQAIAREPDKRVRNALATNLSDLLRYQNLLCRYDTMALKSLDIFSVHGFPVGLVQCESNLLGIPSKGGTNVGSGGWSNIIEKYVRAKAYCDRPFEVYQQRGRKTQVFIPGEWIGDQRNGRASPEKRQVHLHCQSATTAELPPASLDAVFTDPPYFGNVQYAELMDFCYVWLRRLVSADEPAFSRSSTRNEDELTGNMTLERDLDYFTNGLSTAFQRMTRALKPGAPLVFTYHHNKLEAYYPAAVAILDAGLTCSASLPCPAEMGASIHISGTGSSIVDTVFVCRSTGAVARRWLAETPEAVAGLVREDLAQLREGGVKLTRGDIRCIIYGHLIRLTIWRSRKIWNMARPAGKKIEAVATDLKAFGGPDEVEKHLADTLSHAPVVRSTFFQEEEAAYGEGEDDEVSF